MKPVLILLTFWVLLLPWANALDKLPATAPAQKSAASIQGPIVTDRIIWSDRVNDDFKIYISMPPNYDSLRFPKYPVVYFLDGGGGSFHTINYEYMQQGIIPEVITIGIGYPGTSQRNRDYTYGFINFYQFLKQELIPQMDKEFNIDPHNRTLFGHSYGGICVLFTMFQYYHYDEILFNNLIAASPSIWYPDGQLAYTRERTLYEQTNILPVNLYMSVGSLEGSMVTDLKRMEQVLIGHNYEYFNMSCHVYEGKDHTTNKEITFREGIQWVLHQEIKILTKTRDLMPVQQMASALYPNPATENVILSVSPSLNNQEITCSIQDINGKQIKIVRNQIRNQSSIQVPVTELPKGMYLLKLSNGRQQQILKFVK